MDLDKAYEFLKRMMDRNVSKGMQVEKISNSQKLNLRKSIGESREDFD